MLGTFATPFLTLTSTALPAAAGVFTETSRFLLTLVGLAVLIYVVFFVGADIYARRSRARSASRIQVPQEPQSAIAWVAAGTAQPESRTIAYSTEDGDLIIGTDNTDHWTKTTVSSAS